MSLSAPVTQHHPAILAFEPWCGVVPAGFVSDWLGSLQRGEFNSRLPNVPTEPQPVEAVYPVFGELYVEYISVLSAVLEADRPFTMFELGAGFGFWSAVAAVALRRRCLELGHLLAVEAEPDHFRFIRQNFADNDIPADRATLIEAAVAPQDGEVFFTCGAPEAWYGQAILNTDAAYPDFEGEPVNVNRVPAISVTSLLADYDFVDLLHLDLQGVEDDVLAAAREPIDTKVRRVCIGTHGAEIEANLQALFTDLGWENEIDVPLGEDRETPWGTATFVDGVQSWTNPRLRAD